VTGHQAATGAARALDASARTKGFRTLGQAFGAQARNAMGWACQVHGDQGYTHSGRRSIWYRFRPGPGVREPQQAGLMSDHLLAYIQAS
jgi:hypothetical protein